MRKMATFMYGGFRGLNDRFNRLETRLFRPAGGRERLLDWLKAVFTDDEWEAALHSRTPGTCGWILQRRQFRSWLSSANGTDQMKILWIHGPPGFGKTVLCASIVEHLQNENPARVAHFFCVSDNEAKRQPFAIVRSWVAQMVRQNQEALEAAEEAYHGKEGRLATISDIWQLFIKICQRIPNCYFIIDGFDECVKMESTKIAPTNESIRFLRGLIGMAKDTPCCFLFASREDTDLRSQFRRLAESDTSIFFEY